MLRFSLLAAVAVLALVVALSLIGPAGAATTTVRTVGTSFQPQSVTIDVGDTVQWTSVSGHTVTSSSPNWSIDATTDTTYTFGLPGRYAYYCKVHGASVMSGDVIVQGPLVALLTGANESPPTASTGSASVTLDFDALAGTVTGTWNVTGMGSNVIGAHVHRGAPGTNGDIVIPFSGVPLAGGSFSTSNASVDPALIREILADPGGFYVNVHTMTNQGGEVRGPLQVPAACDGETLGASLMPGNESPPKSAGATGQVTLTFDQAAGTIVGTWNVTGASSNIIAGHIHQNAAGANGPIVVPFAGVPSAGGQFTTTTMGVAPQLIANILANPSAFYVNVHTSQNPSGETRGQLTCPRTWLPLILRNAIGA